MYHLIMYILMFSELVWQAIELICDQLSGKGDGGGFSSQYILVNWYLIRPNSFYWLQTTDNFYDEQFQS